MSQPDFRIKQVEPIRVLTLRFMAENHLHLARVTAEIRTALREKSFQASSYPIHITYATEYSQNHIDAEFALPIDDSWVKSVSLATFGTMTVRELPGVEAATYIHIGDPADINDGLADLQRWVAEQGYRLSGSIRIVYLRGKVVPLPMEEWMFEVQHPIER